MTTLPQDPMMLLSYVNTKLRDCYSSLQDFCENENADELNVLQTLRSVGYEYDREKNKFI